MRNNGRRHRATGLYFSVKCGRHLPYESRLELHDLWRAEVDGKVLECRPQPFVLDFMQDGRRRRYTPDRLDVLAGSGLRVVEVKEGPELDPEDVERLAVVEDLLASRGMSFEVHMRQAIEAQPTFAAVEAVQRRRRTAVDDRECAAIERRLVGGPLLLSEAVAILGGGALGFAKACALIVRRGCRIDLGAGLGADVEVRAVAPC